MHYNRWRRKGDPGQAAPIEVRATEKPCSVGECPNVASARGWCKKHYMRWHSTGSLEIPDRSHLTLNAGKDCSFSGCGRPAKCKGLCSAHYSMSRAKGSLSPIDEGRSATLGMTLEERFEYYAGPPNEKGCRLWGGGLNDRGYGTIHVSTLGANRLAHRVSYELHYGTPIPPHTPIHHVCAVPSCVNPLHLQVVESWENSAEMMERNWYKARIEALEGALADLRPEHPLLVRP